jgi:hypothetical protein
LAGVRASFVAGVVDGRLDPVLGFDGVIGVRVVVVEPESD